MALDRGCMGEHSIPSPRCLGVRAATGATFSFSTTSTGMRLLSHPVRRPGSSGSQYNSPLGKGITDTSVTWSVSGWGVRISLWDHFRKWTYTSPVDIPSRAGQVDADRAVTRNFVARLCSRRLEASPLYANRSGSLLGGAVSSNKVRKRRNQEDTHNTEVRSSDRRPSHIACYIPDCILEIGWLAVTRQDHVCALPNLSPSSTRKKPLRL